MVKAAARRAGLLVAVSACTAALWLCLQLVRPLSSGSQRPLPDALPAAEPQAWQAPVEPGLLRRALTDPDQPLHFLVGVRAEPDPDRPPPGLDETARRTALIASLRATAEASQAELRHALETGLASGRVLRYRPLWILNGLSVTADGRTLLELAARPDVAGIREDRWLQRIAAPVAAPGPSLQAPYRSEPGTAWNLAQIRAPEVWTGLGLDGTGVVIAVLDTGVDWQHPLIQSQYRGYNPHGPPVHAGNWTCTTDEGYLYPGDGHGHGTHVTGIAVGGRDGEGMALGVAPGSRWIAAKAFNNAGYAFDSWIHAAFEWVLAPEGDPALAPEVVNNSWGIAIGDSDEFQPDLLVLREGGILPVFSAGNQGPEPGTISSPASLPEALAVGASDEVDDVADWSSRGPSAWGEVKPEVVAPGVMVRSGLPGGAYGEANGTSMAAPHVAGTAALLLQADPTLSVEQVEALLTSTARPIGSPVPNNEAGWGRIDAYRASATALGAGTLAGSVLDAAGGLPVAGSALEARDHGGDLRGYTRTDSAGQYALALPSGTYDVSAGAFGYQPGLAYGVPVSEGLTTTLSFGLLPLPSGCLSGTVTDAATGAPLAATVSALGTPAATISDPADGHYSLELPEGLYSVQFRLNGFRTALSESVPIAAGSHTPLDARMAPAPRLLLVDSGTWYYGSQASYFRDALEDRRFAFDEWVIRHLPQDRPTSGDLAPYDVVIWSAPLDSPGLIGAGDVISTYLSVGGSLLLTGQDIGLWDGGLTGAFWAPYYTKMLAARALTDDVGEEPLVGIPGDLLDGLNLPLNGPDSAQNQEWPDGIDIAEPRAASLIGRYAGGEGAALRVGTCLPYRAVYLAAGLEGLGDRAGRAETTERLVDWLWKPPAPHGAEGWPAEQAEVRLGEVPITYTWHLRNTGAAQDTFVLSLSPGLWPTSLWDESFSVPLPPSVTLQACEAVTIGIQVDVPPDAGWDARDAVTLTAQSLAEPGVSAEATLQSKTPAPILLVDDHRWYGVAPAYRLALEASRLPYDLWANDQSPLPDSDSPSLARLLCYPVVVWFTGYDWYSTLTPGDEARLSAYLEAGGRLLLSSQDYLYTAGLTGFGREYLGIAGYTEGLTATSVYGAVGHPVALGSGPYSLDYPFQNWSDALRPQAQAQIAFWGQHGQPVALTGAGAQWKTFYAAFPLEALPASELEGVAAHAVGWLSPLGDSLLGVDRRAVAPGQPLSYSLLLRNTGAGSLQTVSLSNTLPLSTSLVDGSLVGPAEYDPVQRRLTWDGPLAPGEAVTVSYSLLPDAGLPAGSAVVNVARLWDESGLALDLVAASWLGTPDLSRSVKLAADNGAHPGNVLTFTLILRNDGLAPAPAHLADPIPPFSAHRPGTAWASSGVVSSTAEAVTWSGTIAAGQQVTVTFPVTVLASAVGRYAWNRALLDDGWTEALPLEAYRWIEARLLLPWITRWASWP